MKLLLVFSWMLITICDASVHSNEIICNFHGKTLNAIAVEEEPFVILNQDCLASTNFTDYQFINVTSCIHGIVVDMATVFLTNAGF